MPKSFVDDILAANQRGEIRKYEMEGDTPFGKFRLRTDGTTADYAEALAALKVAFASPLPPVVPALPKDLGPTLAEAVKEYFAVEEKNLLPNTCSQRKRACVMFVAHFGENVRVGEITKRMGRAWGNELQKGGLSKASAANLASHVARMLNPVIDGEDDEEKNRKNPAYGVVPYRAKERSARKDKGYKFEPFQPEDLRRMFDPKWLEKATTIHVRWGALIGLYSGARVGEIAQIFLNDFVVVDGTQCIRMSIENDGQSKKNPESKRLVPVHPDLIRLGLMERVDTLRQVEAERLFPEMKIDSKAGPGNSISKGFSYYIKTHLGIAPHRKFGIVGFHSLRKVVIQELQGDKAFPAERRRALVGHEDGDNPKDVHEVDYMRKWTAAEIALFFPALRWGQWLDFDGLRELLHEKPTNATANA
jgi:integrase